MTQAEVEDRANLSRRYLSNIERGRSIPSIDVLMQIADVLHCTPNELLLGAAASGRSEQGMQQNMDGARLLLAAEPVSGLQQESETAAALSSGISQSSGLAAALSADLKRLSGYKQAIARSFIDWLETQRL